MKSTINKLLPGALAIVIAALLWSLDGTFLRPKLYTLPSSLVVFLEHVLGFVVLLPFLIAYRKQIKLLKKTEWFSIFWVALFGGALGTTFITKALFLTGFKDISVVILLQKFQPIFAILLASLFLKERFPRKFYLYALLAVVGGYFVTFKDPVKVFDLSASSYLVALFSLLAAFAWGSSTAFGKYSIKNISYGLLSALRFGLTVIIMLVPAFSYFKNITEVSGTQWSTFATIVFTSGALAMFLYYYGLKKIPASVATLCELAWPVSAIFFDMFINKNTLSITQMLGTVLLFIAVFKATSLNKSYLISGKVTEGMQKGRELGMKTINLEVNLAKGMPKGLYFASLNLSDKKHKALLYYGFNSIKQADCLEAHILDFEGDIYGSEVSLKTEKYLRLPKKFTSMEDLKMQLKDDLEFSKSEEI